MGVGWSDTSDDFLVKLMIIIIMFMLYFERNQGRQM